MGDILDLKHFVCWRSCTHDIDSNLSHRHARVSCSETLTMNVSQATGQSAKQDLKSLLRVPLNARVRQYEI